MNKMQKKGKIHKMEIGAKVKKFAFCTWQFEQNSKKMFTKTVQFLPCFCQTNKKCIYNGCSRLECAINLAILCEKSFKK